MKVISMSNEQGKLFPSYSQKVLRIEKFWSEKGNNFMEKSSKRDHF